MVRLHRGTTHRGMLSLTQISHKVWLQEPHPRSLMWIYELKYKLPSHWKIIQDQKRKIQKIDVHYCLSATANKQCQKAFISFTLLLAHLRSCLQHHHRAKNSAKHHSLVYNDDSWIPTWPLMQLHLWRKGGRCSVEMKEVRRSGVLAQFPLLVPSMDLQGHWLVGFIFPPIKILSTLLFC